jgi:hypothetical protein
LAVEIYELPPEGGTTKLAVIRSTLTGRGYNKNESAVNFVVRTLCSAHNFFEIEVKS